MRTSLHVILVLLLAGCHGSISIVGINDDDDDVAADDDDTADDDDDATDDDDASTDDDDIANDDDVADDDDFVPDDDDVVPDDDDVVADDDDAVDTCVPVTLSCGDTIETSNDAVSAVSAYNSWSCVGGGESGPEVFFDLDPGDHLAFTVTMSGHEEDLDLFVLAASCDPEACVGGSWNPGTETEEVELEVSAGDALQAVVDGWDGAVSEFSISMACGPSGDDDDDDDDDIAPDDDDIAPDDDDIAPDDDDIAPDDDDVAPGDDADGDGFTTPDDCDDGDPAINPGATEVCDGVDNDCSGSIDDGTVCTGCGQGEFDGHTYQFCTGFPIGWNDAAALCSLVGYYLVTVNNEPEDDFIEDHVTTSLVGAWWIGYNDQGFGNEGNYEWAGGNGSGYENWAAGEPNNAGGFGGEDCVEKRGEFGWEWNDIPCNTNSPYVCELDE